MKNDMIVTATDGPGSVEKLTYKQQIERRHKEKEAKPLNSKKLKTLKENGLDFLASIKVSKGKDMSRAEMLLAKTLHQALGNRIETRLELYEYLCNEGIPEHASEVISDKICKYECADDVLHYFNNRTLTLDEIKDSKFNIVKYLTKRGIDPHLTLWLLDYAWNTTPSIGKGEVALSLVLKGAKMAKTGDIEVDGEIIEVKGVSARLVGQSGFGNHSEIKNAWAKAFKNLIEEHDLDYKLTHGDNCFNFTKDNWKIDILSKEMFRRGVTRTEISQAIARGIQAKYKNIDFEETALWVSVFINKKTGAIDKKGFLRRFSIAGFEYYAEQEGFSHMICLNDNNGEVMAFDVDSFAEYLDEDISISMGGYGSQGGSQGPHHSITLK